jgi:hypothetical protein
MNASQVANRILYRHRAALQASKPTALTLAHLLVEAAEAGYAAALQNQATSKAITVAALFRARSASR